jgi:thiamine-phosphate pyrophosphorylase
MRSKKKRLEPSRLCVIIDCGILDKKKAIRVSRAAASAGCDMLQLRCKDIDTLKAIKIARPIKAIALRRNIPFIINDRVEVASAVGAHGLHIGRGDIGVELAWRILKKGSLIGVSASNLSEARSAKAVGADYIGVGPVFKTPIKAFTKPIGIGTLKKIRSLGVPLFVIGGIGSNNIDILVSNGFKSIAVIRAVLDAKDPFKATLGLKKVLS